MYISTVTDCDFVADVLPVRVKRQITKHVQPYTHRARIDQRTERNGTEAAKAGPACLSVASAHMSPAKRRKNFYRG